MSIARAWSHWALVQCCLRWPCWATSHDLYPGWHMRAPLLPSRGTHPVLRMGTSNAVPWDTGATDGLGVELGWAKNAAGSPGPGPHPTPHTTPPLLPPRPTPP
eukprot:14264350-Alexandrium_andersonii.AAC.1